FVAAGLSCNPTLCAALSFYRSGVVVSQEPAGSPAPWTFIPVPLGPTATQLYGVSCASRTLCDLVGLSEVCHPAPHGPLCPSAPPTTIYSIDPTRVNSARQVEVLPNVVV